MLLFVFFCLQILVANNILIPPPLSRGSPLHFVELHFTLLEALFNLSSVPYQFFVHFYVDLAVFLRIAWVLSLTYLALLARFLGSEGRYANP